MSLHTGLPHANKESQTSGQSAGVFGSSVSSAGQSAAASSSPPSPPPFFPPPSSFHKAPRIPSSVLLRKREPVPKPSSLLLFKPTLPVKRHHPYVRPSADSVVPMSSSPAPDWVLTFKQRNEKLQEDRKKARVKYEIDGSFQVDANGYPIYAVFGANGELDFDPVSGFM